MRPNNYILDMIERQMAANPDLNAVVSKEGILTYRDLRRAMVRVSGALSEYKAETAVAVCMDRSAAWVAASLGVFAAGCLYVPIDPLSPLQRKLQMIKDVEIKAIITQAHLVPMLPVEGDLDVLNYEALATSQRGDNLSLNFDNAAYGIYTSGSTGRPKCVIIQHQALSNYLQVLSEEMQLSRSDRYLHTASIEFSASIRQLVAPLASGAGIVIADREDVRDPLSLISLMIREKVSVFDTVPSYLSRWASALLDAPPDWRAELSDTLKMVICTGEPLAMEHVTGLRAALPDARVFNYYGQTETTGTVAFHEVSSDDPNPIPIGFPARNSIFHVLDEAGHLADAGELYVSGKALSRGYWRLPSVTAERFLPDPFSADTDARMYRTGDLVVRIPTGQLQFRGRVDNQVKFHGIRIDLGEVDATVLRHPDIESSATVMAEDGYGDSRLVTYVVPRQKGKRPSVEELRAFLGLTLILPMIPSVIIYLDRLPVTATGKIDRPGLRSLNISTHLQPTKASVPTSTHLEASIARCWEEILHVKGIGREDDFFALGGDSIQAIQMVFRMQKELVTDLPLAAIFFENPILRVFAKAIEVEGGLQDEA